MTKTTHSMPKYPAMPSTLKELKLNPNAEIVLSKRYFKKDEDDKPLEAGRELFWRVASAIAFEEKSMPSRLINLAI